MKNILIILSICIPMISIGQQKQGQALIDSFLKELAIANDKNLPDTLKENLLIELSFDYYSIDPDKGINYGKKGLELSQKLNRKRDIALANYNLGANYCVKGDFPSALEHWLIALKLNEELKDKKNIAKTLSNIGRIYVVLTNTKLALEYYHKSLKVFEDLKDTISISYTLGDMGSVYEAAKNYDLALEYYNNALSINKKIGDTQAIASNITNIGLVFQDKKDYNRALEYYFEASKLDEELENKNGLITNYGNIGITYLSIAKKTTHVEKSINLFSYANIANLKKAKEYLDMSIAISKELGDINYIQEYAINLSETEALLGNFKAALEDYKLYATAKDSVFSMDNNVKIANLETKRELDLKQKDIELKDKAIALDKLAILKKRNERGYFIAGLGLLSCIIVVVFRNFKIQKHSNASLTISNALLTSEKKRSDDLLLNILPAEVADELKTKGTSHARQYDNVTVIFTDFVNFTRNAESMTPQQLVDELDVCFKAFDTIIEKYNIEKIKTIGDAYLAVSGLPSPDLVHAENALLAAMEINHFVQTRLAQLGNKTFQVRIGIHSGSVVAGIVGVKKYAYDIWGDTVNTAARMEQNSEPGKINISQTTYDLVNSKIPCTYRGEVDAKGKGKMKMYFVG